MILLRLSGHSCAGKTRLVKALPQFGITCRKVVRYTSRAPRPEEQEGKDYYFRSAEFIASLPEKDFLTGPVRNIFQAFDLKQLEQDLKSHQKLLIEIYPALWPLLIERIENRIQQKLTTVSVFITAVDPAEIIRFTDEEERVGFISSEVYKMLLFRNKDKLEDIKIRAHAAAGEILEAMNPIGQKAYDRIIHSAPEGPEGEDDWTRERMPVGQAKAAMEEFIGILRHSGL